MQFIGSWSACCCKLFLFRIRKAYFICICHNIIDYFLDLLRFNSDWSWTQFVVVSCLCITIASCMSCSCRQCLLLILVMLKIGWWCFDAEWELWIVFGFCVALLFPGQFGSWGCRSWITHVHDVEGIRFTEGITFVEDSFWCWIFNCKLGLNICFAISGNRNSCFILGLLKVNAQLGFVSLSESGYIVKLLKWTDCAAHSNHFGEVSWCCLLFWFSAWSYVLESRTQFSVELLMKFHDSSSYSYSSTWYPKGFGGWILN